MAEYAIVLSPLPPEDGGGFVGLVPDLPGCVGDGETAEEALADTQDAIIEWLEANDALGRLDPEPGQAAEELRNRDKAMIEAVRAALDYIDKQDGEISDLKRKIETLTALMKDDGLPRRFAGLVSSGKKPLKSAH